MQLPVPLPGFLAADTTAVDRAVPDGLGERRDSCGPVTLATWGVQPVDARGAAFILSRVVRTRSGPVPPSAVSAELAAHPGSLGRLLPPFAAVGGSSAGVTMVADSMGMRQLYHGDPAAGPSVMSTSALLAARAIGAEPDETAIAVQSQLGWQLGRRTLFAGVHKLDAGAVARLDAAGVGIAAPEEQPDRPIGLDEAVTSAARILRESLASLLDEHPEAVLQLTGGQDSRLLLSAIPAARRRGLRAMTLGVPGDGDVEVAGSIAAAQGMTHEVHGMGALDRLAPADAWASVVDAAVRLDGMADPVALAALTVAESAFEQGVRISGLGGEVARGFYYLGRVVDRPYTRQDSDHLADWRMFANESVEADALEPQFAAWAAEQAHGAVYDAVAGGGSEWFRATDALYLRHRMQRWAGVTDTAVSWQRVVDNPMLDDEFIGIANALAPRDKAHSRFLAALQMELDPELGRIPLEGRPAPIVFVRPGLMSSSARTLTTARKAARKVAQRLSRGNRAPAGGAVLAAAVAAHWRAEPGILDPLATSRFVNHAWIEGVLAGRIEPRPSSVAWVTNLLVASTTT